MTAFNSSCGSNPSAEMASLRAMIYSLTTSRQDLMPRGRKGDFLFSPNRLNVAVSRAKCLAYMVGTEELMDTHASSISEMEALNHFCRYVDDLSVAE